MKSSKSKLELIYLPLYRGGEYYGTQVLRRYPGDHLVLIKIIKEKQK